MSTLIWKNFSVCYVTIYTIFTDYITLMMAKPEQIP